MIRSSRYRHFAAIAGVLVACLSTPGHGQPGDIQVEISPSAIEEQAANPAHAGEPRGQQQAGDFAAILLLTRQAEAFREAWAQPARPDYRPEIRTTEQAIRGEAVEALVLFSGCRGNDENLCDVTVEFSHANPDGSIDTRNEVLPLWQGAPEGQVLLLGTTSMQTTFEASDPLGIYRLQAKVCDGVAGVCVELARDLALLEPSEAVDFADFVHRYYLDPRPLLIEPAMDHFHQHNLLANPNARAPVIAFFAMVMADNPDRRAAWADHIESLDGDTQSTLRAALTLAEQPRFLLDDHPPSPGHNDMLWGAYFATGREEFVHAIVHRLAHLDERTDLNLFLTASSAQWSLSANAINHVRVRQALEALQPTLQDEVTRQAVEGALIGKPDVLRQAMVEVLQAQKEAGVW